MTSPRSCRWLKGPAARCATGMAIRCTRAPTGTSWLSAILRGSRTCSWRWAATDPPVRLLLRYTLSEHDQVSVGCADQQLALAVSLVDRANDLAGRQPGKVLAEFAYHLIEV